jgi:SAM-dependent methyltransferase
MRISELLPPRMKNPLAFLKKMIRYYGTERFCPVCGRTSRKFEDFGIYPRKDALCVWCGALERHRLVWLFFESRTDLFDGRQKNVLHVAAERCFESRFRLRIRGGYFTADLSNSRAMVKLDITNIPSPDGSFDVIYCSHVLEHVLDDRKAISEFYRTLKMGGWAVILVPTGTGRTFEDISIVDPKERLRVFGNEDHVRTYGPDYADRLLEAGLKVELIKASDFIESDEILRMGITSAAGDIYYCTK